MKSATNHVLVITGTRRTGKTTELVGLHNDASESPSSHVCFMASQKPGPEELANRTLLIFYPSGSSAVKSFLDIHEDQPVKFTHLFIDDLSNTQLDDVLHLAKRMPELNIAVALRT